MILDYQTIWNYDFNTWVLQWHFLTKNIIESATHFVICLTQFFYRKIWWVNRQVIKQQKKNRSYNFYSCMYIMNLNSRKILIQWINRLPSYICSSLFMRIAYASEPSEKSWPNMYTMYVLYWLFSLSEDFLYTFFSREKREKMRHVINLVSLLFASSSYLENIIQFFIIS